ncbi:hypothetical protein N566_19130 [Streptomycetaceae bacterium MP113-05]|nr:hypothetical protein N566_19130 [Streptomycetaceae bacterium MP113-05]
MSNAAVAAAVMAALTASQAPGIELAQGGADGDSTTGSLPDGAPGDDSYHTELPPLATPVPPGDDAPGEVGPEQSGIPASVLAAYRKAERSLAGSDPSCHLPWQLLAAIGKVESGQARGGAVDKAGTTLAPILGPQLNGAGFARIHDTDGGAYDGDPRYDRAVGPMQFIPSTWADWGADGNGDGRKDPNNIHDAALAAGGYLCHDGRDLAVKADLDSAVLSYNHSDAYLRTVLAWLDFYREGVHEVPDGAGPLPTSPGAGGDGLGVGRDDRAGDTADEASPGGTGNPSEGSSPSPEPDPSDEPSEPSESTDPGDPADPGDPTEPTEDVPAVLERVGAAQVTTTAGHKVADGYRVRVTTEDGAPVAEAKVRYEIVGETGARFPRDARAAEVSTGAEGTANAPALLAGSQPGTFTVFATVTGHDGVTAAEFTTTVAPAEPRADLLQRVDGEGVVQAEAGAVCPVLRISATYQGGAAAGAAVTATVLHGDGRAPTAGTGPYFAGEAGAELHTLSLDTDAEGRLTLPDLYAGDEPGPYRLRLTTVDGGDLVLDVSVTPASTPSHSPTPTPTGTTPTPTPTAS